MYENKKLSIPRLLLALILIGGIVGGIYYYIQHRAKFSNVENNTNSSPWFGPYVDVTATPTYNFEQSDPNFQKNVILSFVVSSEKDPCDPSWGKTFSINQAANQLDLDRRIARLRQNKINLAISFGGLLNDELALKCTNQTNLENAYKKIIDHYQIDTIDLDLEQKGLTDSDAMQRRAKALYNIQTSMRANNKNLAIWLTLPVAPTGLTNDGTNAVSTMLENKVDISGVNVMTFDYGQSQAKNQSLYDASISALNETHRQVGIIYAKQNIFLSSQTIWSKIGVTPMIGQTDDKGQILSLEMAKKINQFVLDNKVGRVSMWSANRDLKCGENYVDVENVSDSCSGVNQSKGEFAKLLGSNIDGYISSNSKSVTTSDDSKKTEDLTDNPDTSPYEIWNEDSAYPQGTKVVWHHNVYEAKWWNQNEVPDNPVLQAYETPWRLVGPVLEGEKPIKKQTLPKGIYPEWSGEQTYTEGKRVMFENVPYQAKWWNKGESPKAASSDPAGSPWVALKQDEIQKILDQQKQ